MATPIIMPRQGQSVESCILTEWKVEVGHEVAEGDVLAVIETDKASFDLESTASGKVLALFWEADDDVPVLANVAAIGEEGENVDDLRPAGAEPSAPPAADPEPSSSPGPANPPGPATEVTNSEPSHFASAGSGAGISPRARKVAMRHGIDPETLEEAVPAVE